LIISPPRPPSDEDSVMPPAVTEIAQWLDYLQARYAFRAASHMTQVRLEFI
jgi:hypothetical protein